MKVPKSFKDVTVSQYQRIVPIYKKIEKETDVITIASDWCRIISVLTNKAPHEIEALDIDKLKSIIKSLAWLTGDVKSVRGKYLFFKGRIYKAKTEAKQFNTAQYVEVKTFLSRGDAVAELHNILASIYTPLSFKGFKHSGETHPERAEIFKQISVAKVLPTVFFYSVQYRNSIRRIQEYGIKLVEKQNKKIEEDLILMLRETLENIGDGTAQSMS